VITFIDYSIHSFIHSLAFYWYWGYLFQASGVLGLVLHRADYCLIGRGIILDRAYTVWIAFQELRGSAFFIQLSYYSPTSIAHSRAGPINHHCPYGNVNTMDITFSFALSSRR
jgi:hypothetical protein